MKKHSRTCVITLTICAAIFLAVFGYLQIINFDTKNTTTQVDRSVSEDNYAQYKKLTVRTTDPAIKNMVDQYLKSRTGFDDYMYNEQLEIVMQQYRVLFKNLMLDADNQRNVERLLTERQMLHFDIPNISHRNEQFEKSISEKAQYELMMQMRNNINEEISGILGIVKNDVFLKFEETIPCYNFINIISEKLAYSENALSQDQIANLPELIASVSTMKKGSDNDYYDILLSLPDKTISAEQKRRIARFQEEDLQIRNLQKLVQKK